MLSGGLSLLAQPHPSHAIAVLCALMPACCAVLGSLAQLGNQCRDSELKIFQASQHDKSKYLREMHGVLTRYKTQGAQLT